MGAGASSAGAGVGWARGGLVRRPPTWYHGDAHEHKHMSEANERGSAMERQHRICGMAEIGDEGHRVEIIVENESQVESRDVPFSLDEIMDATVDVVERFADVLVGDLLPDRIHVVVREESTFGGRRCAYGEFHKARSQARKRIRRGPHKGEMRPAICAISIYTMRFRKRKRDGGRTWYTQDGERISDLPRECWLSFLDGLMAHEIGHFFDWLIRSQGILDGRRSKCRNGRRTTGWPDGRCEAIANGAVELIGSDATFPWNGGTFSQAPVLGREAMERFWGDNAFCGGDNASHNEGDAGAVQLPLPGMGV